MFRAALYTALLKTVPNTRNESTRAQNEQGESQSSLEELKELCFAM
jgi:hypothetical protein